MNQHYFHHQNARLARTLYFSYISYSLHKYSEYFIIYIHICSKTYTLHLFFVGRLWSISKIPKTAPSGKEGAVVA